MTVVGIRTRTDKSLECALGYPEACSDPGCLGYDHLPDRDDIPVWTDADELASWLDDDRVQERRADR